MCSLLLSKVKPVSILYKSIVGRYWPVRVADGPITARYRFIKNASWESFQNLFLKAEKIDSPLIIPDISIHSIPLQVNEFLIKY